MSSAEPFPLSVASISCRQGSNKYYIAPHVHRQWQWFSVLKGGVKFKVGEEQYRLGPNDSILIPPALVRSPRLHRSPPLYLYAVFDIIGGLVDPFALEVIKAPLNLEALIGILRREVTSPGFGNARLYQQCLLLSILFELGRVWQGAQQATGEGLNRNYASEVAERVLTFMRSNLHRPLAREDFAGLVSLSVSQVSRLFTEATGKSLISALTELRIEKAGGLLASSTLTITQIGHEVGFNSFSHFTQTFKRVTGYSPSTIRKTAGGGGALCADCAPSCDYSDCTGSDSCL